LMMEEWHPSEKSIDFQPSTRRYTPEDRTLRNHRCENLKSYMLSVAQGTTSNPMIGWEGANLEWDRLWKAALVAWINVVSMNFPGVTE
jgi:hypothetical protein